MADIGLSVEGATGVAQAAADLILLDADFQAAADGVEEGRRTLGGWFGFTAPTVARLHDICVVVIVYLVFVELLKPCATGRRIVAEA